MNRKTNLNGSYIRFQFTDRTGSIELVAFNQFAVLDSLKDLKLNNVYMISYVDVKEMNLSCQKWPSKYGSAYELQVSKETEINCIDDTASEYLIEQVGGKEKDSLLQHNSLETNSKKKTHTKYESRVPLNLLDSIKLDSLISVLGLIVHVDAEVRHLVNKDNLSLRNFKIIDPTSHPVSVAVWGSQADEFSLEVGDIVDIEKCKLTNYGGRSLSIIMCSTLRKIETQYDLTEEVANLIEFGENLSRKRNLEDNIHEFSNKHMKL
jgi:hypothetical protein